MKLSTSAVFVAASTLCAAAAATSWRPTVSRSVAPTVGRTLHPRGIKPIITSKQLPSKDNAGGGTSTAPQAIINLIKSIVGAAVFGVPAGIAAFGNAPSAVLSANVLLVGIGALAAHGFATIGTLCQSTGATTYRTVWSRTVGPSSSWMPAVACFMVTACTVLTYSIILSSTVPALLSQCGVTLSPLPALVGVTGLVILPLCLQSSLSALAPFSFLGIMGMLFTAVCMMVRHVTGAYRVGGILADATPVACRPSFGTKGWTSVLSPNAAILVSMLSTAYMAHYNAPKLYWDLKDRTQNHAFTKVVWASFGGAMMLMILIGSAGYLTFGASSQSLILNNYAPSDALLVVSRMAVTMSLLVTYPLAFVGVRDGFLDLAPVPLSWRTHPAVTRAVTIGGLTVVTGLALVVSDMRVILSLGGATWGNLLVYVFPATMMVCAARRTPTLQRHVPVCVATGLLGVGMGLVGTYKAIQALY